MRYTWRQREEGRNRERETIEKSASNRCFRRVKLNNSALLCCISQRISRYSIVGVRALRRYAGEIYRLMKRVALRSLHDTIMAVVYFFVRASRANGTRHGSLITPQGRPVPRLFSLDFTYTQNYMGVVTKEAYPRGQ